MPLVHHRSCIGHKTSVDDFIGNKNVVPWREDNAFGARALAHLDRLGGIAPGSAAGLRTIGEGRPGTGFRVTTKMPAAEPLIRRYSW